MRHYEKEPGFLQFKRKIVPAIGNYYNNEGGGKYLCMGIGADDSAIMQNVESGWTFIAHGLGKYINNTIDWDYSTGGRFL